MTKSEYEELKYYIDEYDKADEGNDAAANALNHLRKWLVKYEEKHPQKEDEHIEDEF